MSEAEAANANCASAVEGLPKDKDGKCRRGRDEKRERKKDDKSVEHVLKALNSLQTTEEKLAAMCKKYTDILNEHRLLQTVAKQSDKKCAVLQREKEQLQAEHSKAILTRSRLENLCRELQRQNKAVKEENMMRIREEEEKKREVVAKFQSKLTEIGEMLKQNNDKNTKLRDDNIDMTAKLKNVCERYEKREQHVEKLVKHMELGVQLADVKLAKEKMEMAVEREALLKEKQQLLLEKAEYKSRLDEMQITEQALRNQITLYNNKYDEFHKALTQSNEAIGGFKTEMERMSKQIRKLEKETGTWKLRYEQTHTSLLKMTEEKITTDQELASSQRKLVALQGLCRSLQAQCVQFRQQLKSSNKDEDVGEIPSNETESGPLKSQEKEIKGSSDGCNSSEGSKKNDEIVLSPSLDKPKETTISGSQTGDSLEASDAIIEDKKELSEEVKEKECKEELNRSDIAHSNVANGNTEPLDEGVNSKEITQHKVNSEEEVVELSCSLAENLNLKVQAEETCRVESATDGPESNLENVPTDVQANSEPSKSPQILDGSSTVQVNEVATVSQDLNLYQINNLDERAATESVVQEDKSIESNGCGVQEVGPTSPAHQDVTVSVGQESNPKTSLPSKHNPETHNLNKHNTLTSSSDKPHSGKKRKNNKPQ